MFRRPAITAKSTGGPPVLVFDIGLRLLADQHLHGFHSTQVVRNLKRRMVQWRSRVEVDSFGVEQQLDTP